MKYREIPNEVDAMQYDGYEKTMNAIIEGLNIREHREERHGNDFHDILVRFWVTTPTGERRVNAGDWLIRDGSTLYTLVDHNFNLMFEPAE